MVIDRVRKITHDRSIARGIALILVASAASILGCTGAKYMSYLTDKRFPPKPESAPIEIIAGETDRPHILIGQVSAWADGPFFEAQSAIDKIKAMARNMGGDAIIRYTGHRAPAGTVGQGGFTAQGLVVRWKQPQS